MKKYGKLLDKWHVPLYCEEGLYSAFILNIS